MKTKISKSEVMKAAWREYKESVNRFGKKMAVSFSYCLKRAWRIIKERVNFNNGIFFSGSGQYFF